MLRRIKRVLSADLSGAGLILGYLIRLLLPILLGIPLILPEGASSVSPFLDGNVSFVRVLCTQAVYPIVIFILGFIPCSRIFASAVIFVRAALAAYSSTAVALYCGAGAEYLLHALSSAALTVLCWAVSKCASDAQRNSSLYTLKFLFFSGILLIILFCRAVALAFV